MQDEKGNPTQARRVNRRPAVTPDMFWPAPKGTRARTPDPVDRPSSEDAQSVISLAEAASRAVSRMNHPSNRAKRITRPSPRAASPEPLVILGEGRHMVDLSDCGNGCGNGVWCQACRSDIRAEALRWLQELNVVRPPSGASLHWGRAWNREILLADY